MAILLTLLLTLHLLCMNVSAGGPLLCVWLGRQRASGESKQLAVQMAVWSIWLLLAGILVGLAVGMLTFSLGDRALWDVLPNFRRKIMWGMLELCFSLGWMGAYVFWFRWRPPQGAVARTLHASLPLLSATNLLYHFPPLLTVMAKVAAGELEVVGDVDAQTFRSLMYQPNVLAHTLHFAWASIAVSGVFLFRLAGKIETPRPFHILGARWALAATAMQLPTGLWLMMTTPPAQQSRLVGGDTIVTGLFLTSMISGFYLLQTLAAISFGEDDAKLPRRSEWLLLGTVFLMTGTLHLLRN